MALDAGKASASRPLRFIARSLTLDMLAYLEFDLGRPWSRSYSQVLNSQVQQAVALFTAASIKDPSRPSTWYTPCLTCWNMAGY